MPNFRYRALSQTGEIVDGLIAAPNLAEVARRIDYLHLVPIDAIVEETSARADKNRLKFGRGIRSEDVTMFTLDLALLLKAGARLDDALELLATDKDISRLQSTVGAIRSSILAGESFADAISHYSPLFPSIYIALVRVGEASGTLEHTLQVLARQRTQTEALRRKLGNALRYPAFVLLAALGVLVFFLTFVLPQFGAVLRDFGAKIDPIARAFIDFSELVTAHQHLLAGAAAFFLAAGIWGARQPKIRAAAIAGFAGLPGVGVIVEFHRTALFCRNLDVLLGAAVPLTTTLRILAEMMGTMGDNAVWIRVVERVRQGSKLSEALAEAGVLPAMAVRMLRLGEETGQMRVLAERIAVFYETKLERSLDRLVGLVGPVAIITISVIVGGLIISVMTSLLSVSQLVG
jgi:general secretion pathway protein F